MSYRSIERPMGGRNIVRTADGAVIPADVGNQDYLAFRAWLDAGNELEFVDLDRAPKVNAERDRRLRRFTFDGREFDFCDGRGSDQNIAGAATLALAAVLTGVGWDENFTWVAADNTTVPMTAQTCLNFGKAAADWKARHIRAARSLKDMSPIPADFADDSRW